MTLQIAAEYATKRLVVAGAENLTKLKELGATGLWRQLTALAKNNPIEDKLDIQFAKGVNAEDFKGIGGFFRKALESVKVFWAKLRGTLDDLIEKSKAAISVKPKVEETPDPLWRKNPTYGHVFQESEIPAFKPYEGSGIVIREANISSNPPLIGPDGALTRVDQWPAVTMHRILHDKHLTPGGVVVMFDQKGRLCVSARRLNSTSIDHRAANIYVDCISTNQTLTKEQRQLLQGLMSEMPENLADRSVDSPIASALKAGTIDGYDSLILNPETFIESLAKWARKGRQALPHASKETVQRLKSIKTGEAIQQLQNTPENRSAVLQTILDLVGKGELKGQPGEILAVIGYKPGSDISQFKPRIVIPGLK